MYYVKALLTPAWDGEKIPTCKVEIRTDIPAAAGETYFQINLVTIFKPFTELIVPFALRDTAGELPFEQKEEQHPPIRAGVFVPARTSEGEVVITYELKLAPTGKNPVFDLGYEKGGMNGSGMTFMPAFTYEEDCSYSVLWDTSALPADAVCAWSFGEGDTTRVGGNGTLMQTFYAAGLMDSVRLGKFAYYWFNNDKILDTAAVTSQIFSYEAKFFKDQGEHYTIFTRKTDQEGTYRMGGTALMRSYMYIYGDDSQINPTWAKFLFAHEMVHNWVHLDDEPFGTCTWYVEGMAEFYSSVLPCRMGIVTREELAGELNKRANAYYENPKIGLKNEEAGKLLMADAEATRVPYGRGFFYLTHADAEIRRATGGEKRLDDVMYALNERFAADSHIKNEAWFEEYGKYVGIEKAKAEYEAFRVGGDVVPEVDCYEGLVEVEKTEGTVRETGAKCVNYRFF